MQNVTSEELLRQYERTLKAYQIPVTTVQGGLKVGSTVVPKSPAVPQRSSVRRR